MNIDRRNFIGDLLTVGAGFLILPGSAFGKRLWVPERNVILPDSMVRGIWDTHYISYEVDTLEIPPPPMGIKYGDLFTFKGRKFYVSQFGPLVLQPHRRIGGSCPTPNPDYRLPDLMLQKLESISRPL